MVLLEGQMEGVANMCAKLLNPEEIAELKLNFYVVDATERFVYFTTEFKKQFFKEYQNGRMPKRIISDMGINTEILGSTRINSVKLHVLQQAERACGFTDMQDSRFRDVVRDKSPEDKIKRLEYELAYTKQELEFVKKIFAANREAQKEWELKQLQVKSI
jgi:hypothetical protein